MEFPSEKEESEALDNPRHGKVGRRQDANRGEMCVVPAAENCFFFLTDFNNKSLFFSYFPTYFLILSLSKTKLV